MSQPPANPAHAQNSGHKVRRPRAARACNLCRLKKNKCDELYPCTYCRSRSNPVSPFPPRLIHVANPVTSPDRNVECVYQGQDVTRGRFTPEYAHPAPPPCFPDLDPSDDGVSNIAMSEVWRSRFVNCPLSSRPKEPRAPRTAAARHQLSPALLSSSRAPRRARPAPRSATRPPPSGAAPAPAKRSPPSTGIPVM